MKKNKMMRLASLLLVLVLMTSSVVGGTFAKYTTKATDSDTARVAKWGFEADASSIVLDNLFVNAYESETDGVSGNTVFSAVDVIAPGTKKEVNFSFAYDDSNSVAAPEVDYEFTVLAEATGDYDELDANPTFVWTLKAPGASSEVKYNTVNDLLAAINALDGATGITGVKYKAGYLPTSFYGNEETETAAYTIGWEWAFEDAGKTPAQDERDTAMGNADELENVTITITITATQVD